MSYNSFTIVWIHLIWGTFNREKSLLNKEFRKRISAYLKYYSDDKGIFMKTNYVNADHVHALISLPTNKNLEEIFQLFKGSSSHWINEQVDFKFRWARGYSAFSVS